MICIYHGIDLDCWCSAAIVKNKYPDCKMVPYDYGQPVPELEEGEDLILVDVSFSMDTFRKFLAEGRTITWLDHHISAIREFDKELRYEVQGNKKFLFSLDPKKAACEITWEFINPDLDVPRGVHLLGRYDCFGHKGTSEEFAVLVFQYAARARWNGWKETSEVLRLTREDLVQMHNAGLYIYQSLCTEAKQSYAKGFVIEFDGYRFLAVNKERFNPINFEINYHKDGYDGFASFYFADGHWKFSLYNDNGKVDCSEICKRRGGGGHAGAAGFVTKNINDYVQTGV